MKYLEQLSSRQWVQIRAALQLWIATVQSGHFHPSRIRGMEEVFKNYSPMNVEEIEQMMAQTPDRIYYTLADLSKILGVTRQSLFNAVRSAGIQPDEIAGKCHVYRADRIASIIERYKKHGPSNRTT